MKRADRNAILVWSAFFILPSAIGFLWGAAFVVENALLASRGTPTVASVTAVKNGTDDTAKTRSKAGSLIQFRYSVDRQTFDGATKCDPDANSLLGLGVGDQVNLTTLPSYPRIAEIEGSSVGPTGASMIFVSIVWTLVGLFGLYLFTPSKPRHHHGKGRLAHK